jgi:aryl-alcohol dehydrogenase
MGTPRRPACPDLGPPAVLVLDTKGLAMDMVTAAVSRLDEEHFRVEKLRLEAPRADEVLVRFTAAGLCHTDLEVAAGNLPTPLPVVAGHEGAGVVQEVGSAVTDFHPETE